MPTICEFFGIKITVNYNDHSPPHFHAKYAGKEAIFDIETLGLLRGQIPSRVAGLIVEWGLENHSALRRAWNEAKSGQQPTKISPPKGA